jgi:hypothetical protein
MVDVVPVSVYELLGTWIYFSYLIDLSRYMPPELSASEKTIKI